jgi:hypothetical protein
LWLVKNGVPYERAFDMEDAERIAHSVVFGEFEGQKFNWSTMRFEKPKT